MLPVAQFLAGSLDSLDPASAFLTPLIYAWFVLLALLLLCLACARPPPVGQVLAAPILGSVLPLSKHGSDYISWAASVYPESFCMSVFSRDGHVLASSEPGAFRSWNSLPDISTSERGREFALRYFDSAPPAGVGAFTTLLATSLVPTQTAVLRKMEGSSDLYLLGAEVRSNSLERGHVFFYLGQRLSHTAKRVTSQGYLLARSKKNDYNR